MTPNRSTSRAAEPRNDRAATAATAAASDPATALGEWLDGAVPRLLRQWGVPGAAVAVTDRERTLVAAGYGRRALEGRSRTTPRTNFAVCSCTKALAAVSAAVAADDGHFEFDQPVRDYYPALRLYDSVLTERISMRDLLSHRSGVPDHTSAWYFSTLSRRETVAGLRHLAPTRDLRTAYQYNNLFYMLAGHIVGELAGAPSWEDFVRERVFKPLGMRTSQFATDADALDEDFAVGHTSPRRIPSRLFRPTPRASSLGAAFGPVGAAGTAVSNVLDMCRLLRVHLNDGEGVGDDGARVRLLSARALAEVHRPSFPMMETFLPTLGEMPYLQQTMGLVAVSYRGHRCLYHTGCFGGFLGMQIVLPDSGRACALLLNSDHSLLHMAIPFQIVDRLLGLDPIDWNARWRKTVRDLARLERHDQAARKAEAEAKAAQPPERHAPPPPPAGPPRALSEYAGTYANPVCGPLVVVCREEELVARFHGFALRATWKHQEVFQTHPDTRGIPFGGFPLRFLTTTVGRIEGVSVAFPFMGDETTFRRQTG